MESIINQKYIRKIPYDVIINNIIPYTYNPISSQLMIDIYSYKKDLNMVKNIYAFDYNYIMLFNDLKNYINHILYENTVVNGNDFITPQYEKILRRNFMISKMKKQEIIKFVNKKSVLSIIISKNDIDYVEHKINYLWGLLTPIERCNFINQIVE
jgi:hypothetical protein